MGDGIVLRLSLSKSWRKVDAAGQRLGPTVTEFVEEREQPLVAGGGSGCCIVAGQPGQGDLPGAVGAQGTCQARATAALTVVPGVSS